MTFLVSQRLSVLRKPSVVMVIGSPAAVQIRQERVQASRGAAEVMLGGIADREQTPYNTGFFVVGQLQGCDPTVCVPQPHRELGEQRIVVHDDD